MLGEQGDIDGAQAAAAEAERLKVQVGCAAWMWRTCIAAAGLHLRACVHDWAPCPSFCMTTLVFLPLFPAVQRSVFEQQAQSRAQSKAGRLGLQNQQVRPVWSGPLGGRRAVGFL